MDDATATEGAVAIRRAAMDLLAHREHSLHELQQKLARRFSDRDLIDSELARLSNERLQSDERFVSTYIDSRARRYFGPAHIRRELRKRGIESAVIDSAFAEAEIDWSAVCRELTVKKFGPNSPVNLEEKARRTRFLVSRGFLSEDSFS